MNTVPLLVVDRLGVVHELTARDGDILMPVLRDRVDLTLGTCGGVMSCGTCRILIEPSDRSRLTQPREDEVELLDALGADEGSRLACQVTIQTEHANLRLTIAAET